MHAVRWFIAIVVATGVCWLFPLFHVVTLKTAAAEKAAATFNATQFVETFWTTKLLTSLDKTIKTEVLLPAIQGDAASAKKKFSRSVGLSEGYFYFVSGSGRIVAVSDDEILLAVTDGSTNAEVFLFCEQNQLLRVLRFRGNSWLRNFH